MTVSFENTVEDGAAWTTYVWKGTPERRRQLHLTNVLWAVGTAAWVFLVMEVGSPEAENLWLHLMGAAVIGVGRYTWQTLGFRKGVEEQVRQARKNKKAAMGFWHAPMEVSIDTEGVRAAYRDGGFLVRWQAVGKVHATDTHLYLEFEEGQFLQVPLRAFGPGEAERFRALIDHYRTAGELEAPDAVTAPPIAPRDAVPAAAAASVGAAAAAPSGPWWRSRESVEAGGGDARQRVGSGQ